MMNEARTTGGQSIGDLLRNAAADAGALLRGEIALARAETGETMNRLAMALVAIIGGTLVAFAALNILLYALVEALSRYMPAWLAAVVVGGVLALIGVIMVQQGIKALRPEGLIPRRTADSLGKDLDMVKERVA